MLHHNHVPRDFDEKRSYGDLHNPEPDLFKFFNIHRSLPSDRTLQPGTQPRAQNSRSTSPTRHEADDFAGGHREKYAVLETEL